MYWPTLSDIILLSRLFRLISISSILHHNMVLHSYLIGFPRQVILVSMEFNLIFTMYSKGIYYINIDVQWYKKPDYILDNSLIVWHGTLFMQIHGCIELLLPSKWLELAIKIDPLSNKSYTRLSILYWVTNIFLECFPSSWRVTMK